MAQFTYSRLSHLLRLSLNKPSVLPTRTEIKCGPACCVQFIRCQVRPLNTTQFSFQLASGYITSSSTFNELRPDVRFLFSLIKATGLIIWCQNIMKTQDAFDCQHTVIVIDHRLVDTCLIWDAYMHLRLNVFYL